MKKIKNWVVMWLTSLCGLLVLTGCSMGVIKDKDLYRKTAFALLCAPKTLTIYGQQRSGARVDYAVKTNTGHLYHCFVRSGFSFSGKTVSDATCQKQSDHMSVKP